MAIAVVLIAIVLIAVIVLAIPLVLGIADGIATKSADAAAEEDIADGCARDIGFVEEGGFLIPLFRADDRDVMFGFFDRDAARCRVDAADGLAFALKGAIRAFGCCVDDQFL